MDEIRLWRENQEISLFPKQIRKLLINFAGIRIFISVTVETNILMISKSKNEHKIHGAIINDLSYC